MMVKVHDKNFEISISANEIQAKIKVISKKITEDYDGKNPLLIAILNGAFIFASDLIRSIQTNCEITFVKVKSYDGMESGGISELIGLNENIKGRDIIIIEDIVDSGNTLNKIMPFLKERQPKSIEIAALLCKPAAIQYPIDVKYTCFDIPNDFVVGYGLDYNGHGRRFADIYKVVD